VNPVFIATAVAFPLLSVTVTAVTIDPPERTAHAENDPVTKWSRGEIDSENGLDGSTAHVTRNVA
jgi:hypothetical protein